MGERKVLNKYFPPDFDPSLIPRRKKPKNMQIEVRMMLPFSIQCGTCGEYMYRGKKFNSRKEEVQDEDYHGIRIFRFYIKCITCSTEITFKTDPKNGDYAAEHGCQRNFEPWRESAADEEAAVQERVQEEKGDAMKALENRTLDSKREMDILDALDEIKAINMRHAKIDTDVLLQQHAQLQQTSDEQKQKELEEDMLLAKQVFLKQKQANNGATAASEKKLAVVVDKPVAVAMPLAPATNTSSANSGVFGAAGAAGGKQEILPATTTTALPIFIVKKKTDKKQKKKAVLVKKPVVTSLVAQYSDSSSENE